MTLQPPAQSFSCLDQQMPTVMQHTQPQHHMLHRSPSGAQKKIRQRRDEKLQQHNRLNSSSFSSTTSLSSSNISTTLRPQLPGIKSSLIDYRSLVDLESYTSILPEDSVCEISRLEKDQRESEAMRSRNSLDKPVRPPRNSDFSKRKFSGCEEEEKNESSVSVSCPLDTSGAFLFHNPESQHPTPYFGGKPTVQVHPMPALHKLCSLSSSTSSISPPETLKKHPPPVPKKPSQIFKHAISATNDSTFSENEADVRRDSPSQAFFWTSKTAKSPMSLSTSITGQKASSPSLLSLSTTPSLSNSFAESQSSECLSVLCNSPSLLSLQNCLNYALNNPEQHTKEQMQQLEMRRQQSMDSLSQKAYERRLDREAVCEELDQVDQIRATVFKNLSSSGNNYNDCILSRLNVHIIQGERLVELETRLRMQLEKLESTPNNYERNNNNTTSNGVALCEMEAVDQRKRRLVQQLEDVLVIRSSYNSRDEELDEELSRLVTNNLFLEWRFYKSTVLKLNVEKKQIDEKLKNAKSQLEALQSMAAAFKPATIPNSPQDRES